MIVLIIILILIGILLLYGIIDNKFFGITSAYLFLDTYTEEVRGKTLQIMQISDLHRCEFGKYNRRLRDRIDHFLPDVIVITGDLINQDGRVPETLDTFLLRLGAAYPCFYVSGNHETKWKERDPEGYRRFQETLLEYGFHLCDQKTEIFDSPIGPINIGGFAPDIAAYQNKVINDSLYQAEIPPVPDHSKLSILLAHNPDWIDWYRKSSYDLIFCGHIHGGTIRIPGWKGLVSPNYHLFPKYDAGMYSISEHQNMIVSRGLGSHTIKFRLFNRPELVQVYISIRK